MEHRRGACRLESDHDRKLSRIIRLMVITITSPIGADVPSVTQWKKMQIRRIAEMVHDLEGGGFLASDSVGID